MTTPPITSANVSWFAHAKKYAMAHKVIATIAALVVLYAGYHTYRVFTAPSTATRYVTTTVASGTVIATITETGQVSASSNIDLQSKSSGEVLSLLVAPGQHVGAGTSIAYLDSTNAQANVRSAEQALEGAKISLAKLQEPASATSLTSAQNAVATAEANLVQIHQTGYNDVSAAFLNLPTVINGLDTVLHGFTVPGRTSQQNEYAYSDMIASYEPTVTQYQTAAENAYQTAYTAYQKSLADFKATPRSADDTTIEALITESYRSAANISDALKAATSLLNFVNTTLTTRGLSLPSTLTAHINTLTSYTTSTNGNVAALSSDAATVTSNERALASANASLAQVQSGADTLDLQSSQLQVTMKQDALATAEQNLADTVVRAPFSGTVAKVNVQQYQTISNGTSVATLVSDNQSVAILVNEVDAAKLKLGQKTTLTFDALPTVSIAGTVSSVNSIGTVTSGVVSYAAVITFDTPNGDVKPGMSASASIIIGTETGLSVPSSAVKTSNGVSTVQMFSPALAGSSGTSGATSSVLPTPKSVVIGLADTKRIIIESGVTAGDQVVSKTITGTAAAAAATQSSLFNLGGGRPTSGVGGGARTTGTAAVRTTP